MLAMCVSANHRHVASLPFFKFYFISHALATLCFWSGHKNRLAKARKRSGLGIKTPVLVATSTAVHVLRSMTCTDMTVHVISGVGVHDKTCNVNMIRHHHGDWADVQM